MSGVRATCLVLGLGGFFSGATGPLLSAYVPPLVEQVLGANRVGIGLVMAIDNVMLLLLLPLSGVASDVVRARGGSRVPLVVSGYVAAAAAMVTFPAMASTGLWGLILAMVVLYAGINVQRSPFQALIADAVPSPMRSLATAQVTFQMCVAAVAMLMLGRMIGMAPAFRVAGVMVLLSATLFAWWFRVPPARQEGTPEPTMRMIGGALATAVRGNVPGMRAVFLAVLLLQLTFQTFTTWYTLHAMERFGVSAEDAGLGFIAWALGGVVGALPAGFIGMRIGRRAAMLLGFALQALALTALNIVSSPLAVAALLGVASASWTLPMVNAYPLFVEHIPPQQRGMLSALYLLAMALGGIIGDPLNGAIFQLTGGYRLLFVVMATFTALAFVAVMLVPRGAGETSDVLADRAA